MTRTWLRNDSIAEEITQETFLRVFRYRDRFEPTGSVSSWIFQIARNLSLDHLRKKKELLPSPADDHEAGILEQFADPKDLADAQLIERMDTQRVEHALSELSEQQREALALRTFSEWSYEEIASEMGMGLGALKSVLHRAKQELVRKLKEQG